ncbi:SAM-dependent methyltransferase [Streptomyces iconiensis]|uniref:SAM-dependent methyltransferase n=1 Tax=Streptomyces iconiensis TaxID=1384038 RepID=A0ABT6ZQ00_9ACTN|nr:SAM-dependent methyltransferase [Streptomyces iconiensis]MDJ1131137.1 SAM-dependent methyltransferase [Streptomyces iconiensis]
MAGDGSAQGKDAARANAPDAPRTDALQVDVTKPHSARMYDYYLGGKTHYAADAEAAEAVVAKLPQIVQAARANRDFMARATRTLSREYGIRQFLDIGTGIPTEPNLHQIAQAEAPEARVVYTDNDPIVLQYARALLHSTPEGRTAYLHADVTRPETIIQSPELRGTLDLNLPVAVSVNALFHFVPDELGPYDIVEALMEPLAPGSFLCLTHGIGDIPDEELSERASDVIGIYKRGGTAFVPRTRAEVSRFFEKLELLEPGLTMAHLWRPDPEAAERLPDDALTLHTGVARKP